MTVLLLLVPDDVSSGRVLRRRSKRQSVSASTASSLSVPTTGGAGREKSLNLTSDTKTSTMKGIKRVSCLQL